MSMMKEEYTLKDIMKYYNRGYIPHDLMQTLEENIQALKEGIDNMRRLRTYTGMLCVDTLETELKKHERFLRRFQRENPEYFV